MSRSWRLTGDEHKLVTFLQLVLLLSLAVILVPAGAHLFEMPGKMALSPQDYMTVQGIYAGWALFGIPIYAAMLLLVWQAYIARNDAMAMWLALVALACLVVTQVIFWAYTFPMNSLTENWTVMPPALETARAQWEYSHSVNAITTLAAFLLGCLSVLMSRRRPD